MVGIFSIGAAAGLGIAWWLMQPIGTRQMADADKAAVVAKARRIPPASSPSPDTRTGIDPSELPYDGKPPPREEGRSAAVSEAPGGLPQVSGSMARAVPPDVARAVPPPAPERPAKSVAGGGTADSTHVPVRPPQAKTGEKQVAKAVQRPRAARRMVKDQEIERIKEQAADELKKKTENQRLKEAAHRNAERADKQLADAGRRGQSKNLHAMVARCEKAPNLIRRELCKWELCSGMWGKNGCPSYEKPTNLY